MPPKPAVLVQGPAQATQQFVGKVDPDVARALGDLQKGQQSASGPAASLPFGRGNLLENLHLNPGSNAIPHQLGEAFRGYILGKVVPKGATTGPRFWLVPQNDAALDATQLMLWSTDDVTVDIWIYK